MIEKKKLSELDMKVILVREKIMMIVMALVLVGAGICEYIA